jgi:hypothetical protein
MVRDGICSLKKIVDNNDTDASVDNNDTEASVDLGGVTSLMFKSILYELTDQTSVSLKIISTLQKPPLQKLPLQKLPLQKLPLQSFNKTKPYFIVDEDGYYTFDVLKKDIDYEYCFFLGNMFAYSLELNQLINIELHPILLSKMLGVTHLA